MAGTIRSKNAKIMIDTSPTVRGESESAEFVVKDFQVDHKFDSFDTTSFGDSSKTLVSGLPSTSFELRGEFISTVDMNQLSQLWGGKPVRFQFNDTKSTEWQGYDIAAGYLDELSTTEEEERMTETLFQYAVTYVPRNDAGDVIQDDVKIVTDVTSVLAKNEETVRKQAIADLSDKTLDLEYVQVHVRPFGY